MEQLSETVREALNILGSGQCSQPNCEGCQFEREEAKAILIAALAKIDGESCPQCLGRRYVKAAKDSQFTMDFCPRCQGSGTAKGYKPVSHWPDDWASLP
jgi:DnaJ-class molecular chaperone